MEIEKKKKLKSYSTKDYETFGRLVQSQGGNRSDIKVVTDIDSVEIFGYKCTHGVYIPYNSPDPNHSDFCSVCYPYLIRERLNEDEQALPSFLFVGPGTSSTELPDKAAEGVPETA
jgi:hypothetical protein